MKTRPSWIIAAGLALALCAAFLFPAPVVFAAEGGSAAESVDSVRRASEAYQEFIDGKRSVTWHDDRADFSNIPESEYFKDGETYSCSDIVKSLRDAAAGTNDRSESGSGDNDVTSVQYAILDGGSLPLLALKADMKMPVVFQTDVCMIMCYDPAKDEIHLCLAEDTWTKSSIRVNQKGVIALSTSVSAFETSYVYRSIDENGDIRFLFTAFYDNREAETGDLAEEYRDIYLASYMIPEKEGEDTGDFNYHTLHRLHGADPTFLYEPSIDISDQNPAAAFYRKGGTDLVSQSAVMTAVLESMDRNGVSARTFFADDPAWIPLK